MRRTFRLLHDISHSPHFPFSIYLLCVVFFILFTLRAAHFVAAPNIYFLSSRRLYHICVSLAPLCSQWHPVGNGIGDCRECVCSQWCYVFSFSHHKRTMKRVICSGSLSRSHTHISSHSLAPMHNRFGWRAMPIRCSYVKPQDSECECVVVQSSRTNNEMYSNPCSGSGFGMEWARNEILLEHNVQKCTYSFNLFHMGCAVLALSTSFSTCFFFRFGGDFSMKSNIALESTCDLFPIFIAIAMRFNSRWNCFFFLMF